MLLEIRNLRVGYKTDGKLVEVVRGVDLGIGKSECVGLVGESGCGKTTVGLSITKLIPERKGEITSGEILFDGTDILRLDPEELRRTRGKRISYVFQEPFSSLNPVFTIYEQIKEALPEKSDANNCVAEIFKSVGLSNIIGRRKVYPHQLSGGMQQRVMIAMAIVAKPDLLILDEPTTALDVTVQKKILELIMELKKSLGLSILFISHDLRVVFELCDRVSIMYAGSVVESAPKKEIVSKARHPYTLGLINSIPSIERKRHFDAIEGKAPNFTELPEGCSFYPRCSFRMDRCREREPDLVEISGGHLSRCLRAEEIASGLRPSQ